LDISRCGFILWLQKAICKSDGAHIFHRSNSEFWTKDLIILLPRILGRGVFFKEADSFIDDAEKFLSINIIFFAISQENSHFNDGIFVLVLDDVVLSSTHIENIC